MSLLSFGIPWHQNSHHHQMNQPRYVYHPANILWDTFNYPLVILKLNSSLFLRAAFS